jgi:hypothetical protein
VVDTSVILAEGKSHRGLYIVLRLSHASLVRPPVLLARRFTLIVKQGWENFYLIDGDSGHPLAPAEEDPAM